MRENEDEITNNPYDNNLLLRFVYDVVGGKMNVYVASITIFFIIPFIIILLASMVDDVMIIPGDGLGFLEDIPLIVMMLVFGLVVCVGYLFFERYGVFFKKMEPVIDFRHISHKDYRRYSINASRFIRGEGRYKIKKNIFYLIWTITAVYAAFLMENISLFRDIDIWRYRDHTITYVAFEIYILLILIFLIAPLLYRFIATILVLNRLPKYLYSKGALKIIPLSPDKSGGLRPIGEIALTFNMIIVLPMFWVAFNILWWGTDPYMLLQLIFYALFLSLVFFIPLSGSHDIMRRSKEQMLERITREFNELYFKVYNKESIGDLSKAQGRDLRRLEMLDRLSKSYEIVDRMPVWPFDLTIIRNFLLSILVPFVFVLIEVLF